MEKVDLVKRLEELGIYSEYFYRKEMKLLAQLLHSDEVVNCIFTGVIDGNRKMVAVTNERVAILFAGALGSGDVKVIKRSAVTSYEYEKKLILPAAEIRTETETYRFTNVQRARKDLFDWAMTR